MSYNTHKGSSRESGFTALEQETLKNRAEHAAKTPEQIAKAKDRRKRRAEREEKAIGLNAGFSAAVAGDPEKITIAGIDLSKKLVKTRIPCPENTWFDRISAETRTIVFRKDDHIVAIRGLPANLVQARAKIQEDLGQVVPNPSLLPQ